MRKYTGMFGLLMLLTLWMPKVVSAQNTESVEVLTYRLFMEQKWDSLLVTGEAAIASGTDYFYLRMRTGRAAIELHRYAKAAIHLEKAREFNELDTDAATLLYLACLYEGRTAAAGHLCSKLTPKMANSVCHDRFSGKIMAEAGYMTSNQNKKYPKTGNNAAPVYTEDHAYLSAKYGLIGMEQQLDYRLSLSASVSTLLFDKQRNVTIRGFDSLSDSYRLSQMEVYLATAITLNKYFVFEPAFRWVKVSFPYPFVNYDSGSATYFIPGIKNNFNDYVAGGQFNCTVPYFDVFAGAWTSRYENNKQTQASLGIMWRPLGSLNLYTTSIFSMVSIQRKSNFLFYQKAGFRLTDWLWTELFASFGDHTGTSAFNARVFYNLSDRLNFYGGGKFIVPLSNNLTLTFNYQWSNSEGRSFKILPSGERKFSVYEYQNQIITGGIVWKING
ncbi:MAG: hypothetical protein RBS33_08880 [Lentimicrobium sp.]|jgi:hypothetical protein|nr:hypothetical protein [Lentimicrobium sp.]